MYLLLAEKYKGVYSHTFTAAVGDRSVVLYLTGHTPPLHSSDDIS